jgi:formylglycine-generating enzyme required for sulfatase activity
VKIIDFGLAMRKQTIETSMAARLAGNTIPSDSVAGTVKYAPPEQMGETRGVKPGPYSDVYAFGKVCCYALFKTTEPKKRHWAAVPQELHEMLEGCTEQELTHRLPSFEPVLQVLQALDSMQSQRNKGEDTRLKAELEHKRREQEEAAAQRQELERLQKQGETKLTQFCHEALDRTHGRLTHADMDVANDISKQHRIDKERTEQIVEEVREQWLKVHPTKSAEIITNSLGMEFAWIPPGTFLMGCPEEEDGSEPGAEYTQHRVTLSKGFYMGVHPVTRGQFARFVRKSGYKTQGEREGGAYVWTGNEWELDAATNWRSPGYEQTDDHPVVCVSWNDGVAFAKWLAEQENNPVRLPTESEWEYSCRAGTNTPFHFGETISTDEVNYDGKYTRGNRKKQVRQKTTPVGSFPANAWGLYDMHGNVFEWCQDWLGDYPQKDVGDPQGPKEGQYRVLRGGSWNDNAECCRSTYRSGDEPDSRAINCGFRVCFSVD